jgi:hypothetical protein
MAIVWFVHAIEMYGYPRFTDWTLPNLSTSWEARRHLDFLVVLIRRPNAPDRITAITRHDSAIYVQSKMALTPILLIRNQLASTFNNLDLEWS